MVIGLVAHWHRACYEVRGVSYVLASFDSRSPTRFAYVTGLLNGEKTILLSRLFFETQTWRINPVVEAFRIAGVD